MTTLSAPTPNRLPLSRFDLLVLAVLITAAAVVGSVGVQNYLAVQRAALPAFLYVGLDGLGRNQLYLAQLNQDLSLTDQTLLTAEGGGVWDFAPAPDGEVVFAGLSDLGMSDLWLISPHSGTRQRLLACPDASCSNARFGPDGRLVAFTLRNVSDFASAFFSPPRIWLLDSLSGEAAPIFSDSQQLGFEPRWSADGQWLSFISPDPPGIGIYNLSSGAIEIFPNAMGEPGQWSPHGPYLVTTETWALGDEFVVHLIQIDIADGERVDLSGDDRLVQDSGPRFSPDGEWIAFRRKELTGPSATRGKQIWVMRADGSQARALTGDDGYDFGEVSWSADGAYLLTRSFPLGSTDIVPAVWLIRVADGHTRQLFAPGDQPLWLTRQP
jgi:TolB protein